MTPGVRVTCDGETGTVVEKPEWSTNDLPMLHVVWDGDSWMSVLNENEVELVDIQNTPLMLSGCGSPYFTSSTKSPPEAQEAT